MKISSRLILASWISLVALTSAISNEAMAYKPELFQKLRLVYEEHFSGDQLNPEFWEVRQSTTWEIKDGVLVGSQSSKEFQEKMLAKGDKGHAGLKPVIWLKKVPENFVCTMRVRYEGQSYTKGFPLLDIGHHIHTVTFSEKATTLTLKKNVETLPTVKPLFSLNEWHNVVIELKKGKILFQVDGEKHVFESQNIDMTGQAQIDFKGIDFGTCQIDDVKLWAGE